MGALSRISVCVYLSLLLFSFLFSPSSSSHSSSSWAAFSVSSQGKVGVPIQLWRNYPARRLGPSLPAWVLPISSQAFGCFESAPGARGPRLGSFSLHRQGLPGRCWLGSLVDPGAQGPLRYHLRSKLLSRVSLRWGRFPLGMQWTFPRQGCIFSREGVIWQLGVSGLHLVC